MDRRINAEIKEERESAFRPHRRARLKKKCGVFAGETTSWYTHSVVRYESDLLEERLRVKSSRFPSAGAHLGAFPSAATLSAFIARHRESH
ncbi:hypothetical protein EYF80_062403 [Liparis tanakae]|uniref:Uncharacterized protein n=1 Tax=Liparis tanakae TaxID=230148 RepID=A0A4Z2EFC5_9TELE|nr:hypothetical protein EYF80_062403 [Liparis tanakae]